MTSTLVSVFAALSDETRWSILAALGEGEVMVALDADALLRRALSIAAGLPSH